MIFNQQKRDAPEKLLESLAASLKQHAGADDDDDAQIFHHAVFCTNVTFKEQGYKPGLFLAFLRPACILTWADLASYGSDGSAVEALTVQKTLAEAWRSVDARTHTHVMKTIEEAVAFVRALSEEEASEGEGEGEDEGTNVQVLVTGSLHLVGGLLEVLDPSPQA